MMEVNPRGWKTRQARARLRQRHGMSREQRAEVREIRRRHAVGGQEQAVVETAPVTEAKPMAPPPGPKVPEHMDWQEMAAELRAAGKFVPPRIGEEKLRQRLMEHRNAEKEVS